MKSRVVEKKFIRLVVLFHLALSGLIGGAGCNAFVDYMIAKPVQLTPEDIYEFEAKHYPNSSWTYLGRDKSSHVFSRMGSTGPDSVTLDFSDLLLPEKYLKGVRGFPRDKAHAQVRAVDIEIFQEHIQVHIEGEEPVMIPFISKGFITADHRKAREIHKAPLSIDERRQKANEANPNRVRYSIPFDPPSY